jgi:DNA-binding response OmpR family regulator
VPLQVLVVDESPYVGDVLVSAFEREGCHASIARDRTAALQLSQSLRPDLITVELSPKLDAHFVEQLVDHKELSETAFIVITPSKRGVPPAIADRAVRIFEKPFYLSEVVATTMEALGRAAHPGRLRG